MFTIDTSTGFGKRIARQLDDERVVWLTTVAPSGTPAPTPVWFLWHDDEILISSEPDKAKLRNVAGHPQVTVNFNATHTGGDVGVISGTAVIDRPDQRRRSRRTTRSTPTTSRPRMTRPVPRSTRS